MKQRLQFVDALRGWAVLGVIVAHCCLLLPPPSLLCRSILTGGVFGVQLFFVVSAFTLCLSADARRHERHPTVNFLLRRLFRITPMYWAAAVFYLAVWGRGDVPLNVGGPHVSLAEIIATFTFTNGFGVYWQNRVVPGGWSVVAEVYFYLLFPFLFARIRSLNAAWAFALLAYVIAIFSQYVLASATPDLADHTRWQEFGGRWLPANLAVFAFGFILYQLLRAPHPENDSSSRTRGRLLIVTALLPMLATRFGSCPLLPLHLLAGLGCLLLAAGLAAHPRSVLAHPMMQRLGKISYSAYLCHFTFLMPLRTAVFAATAADHPYASLAAFVLATLALTVVAATITYRLVELPGIAAGRRLIDRLESRHVTAASPMTAQPALTQTW